MSRTISELRKECESIPFSVTGEESKAELMDLLATHYWMLSGPHSRPMLPQIRPMLGIDSKDLSVNAQLGLWNDNNGWLAEEKLDGFRMLMFIGLEENRLTSRRRSDRTYIYNEKTDNFPHLRDWLFPKREFGSVLDGEGICRNPIIYTGKEVTTSVRQSTMAISNSGPETSIELQRQFGPIEYVVFDILRWRGADIRHWPLRKRYAVLQKFIFPSISGGAPEFHIIHQVSVGKRAYYEEVIESGGEGLMFKRRMAEYINHGEAARSRCMVKHKKHVTIDAFITGFVPGRRGNTGKVGAFVVSAYDEEERLREVGACQPLGEEERLAATDPESGGLRASYYGRCLECRGQEVTKNLRYSFLQQCKYADGSPVWRDDKSQEECYVDLSEMKAILRKAGIPY